MVGFALCTSSAIVAKAGIGVNSDAAASGALLNLFYLDAVGEVVESTRRDWVASVNTLNPAISGAISAAISALAGNSLANYDPSLYFSREVFQTQLDVNRDQAGKIIKDLRDFDSNNLKSP